MSAHAVLMRRFAAEDIWEDVSVREYDVLYTLAKCPSPVRIGELRLHVLLSQPALSRLVDRLVDRGWIERRVDDEDRRGVRLSLSEAGRQVQRRIGRRHARSVAASVNGALDAEELRNLEAICRKLADHSAEGFTTHSVNHSTNDSTHDRLSKRQREVQR